MEYKVHFFDNAPKTANNLVAFEDMLRKINKVGPDGLVGNVGPGKYGSIKEKDLGLCYFTFCSYQKCPDGQRCRWRHRKLDSEEREWMCSLGGGEFLKRADKFYISPELPKETLWLRTLV